MNALLKTLLLLIALAMLGWYLLPLYPIASVAWSQQGFESYSRMLQALGTSPIDSELGLSKLPLIVGGLLSGAGVGAVLKSRRKLLGWSSLVAILFVIVLVCAATVSLFLFQSIETAEKTIDDAYGTQSSEILSVIVVTRFNELVALAVTILGFASTR